MVVNLTFLEFVTLLASKIHIYNVPFYAMKRYKKNKICRPGKFSVAICFIPNNIVELDQHSRE